LSRGATGVLTRASDAAPTVGVVDDARAGGAIRRYDVVSADGTRLRAWTNDADGPTVLLCNGLGANPHAWPGLLRPDCGVRVISWNHRGVGGSERPTDPSRVSMAAFVEDALAVMDDAGVRSCAVMGWSFGVNIAFELAVEHPERVTGVFAVAGVPGGSFASMGAPLVPRFARQPLAVGVTKVLGRSAPVLGPMMSRVSIGPTAANLLRYSGVIGPSADRGVVERTVGEFLTTPVGWYMHLGRAAAQHEPMCLRRLRAPGVLVGGTFDLLASSADMRTVAKRIPGWRYVEICGSHSLPIEQPAAVHRELLTFLVELEAGP
jgi:pimeloyl-ACP methyl ester carboxylesterase